MPRSAKGPRLGCVQPATTTKAATPLSGSSRTPDTSRAQAALQQTLLELNARLSNTSTRKHTAGAKAGGRDPAAIPIADVLNFYAEQVVPKHARPKETLQRIARLAVFFNGYKRSANSMASYAAPSSGHAAKRRQRART